MEVLTSEEETRILTETSNIDVDKLEHYIDLFEKWFDGQKHLPKTYGGSCFKKFLIWAKLDFEKAKKRFVKFCYNTVTHKEFFCNRSITLKTELEPLKYLSIVHMPKLTPNGFKVNIVKMLDSDLLDVNGSCRYISLAFQYRLYMDNAVPGEIIIFDGEGFKPQHIGKAFNYTSFNFVKLTILHFPFLIKRIFAINCHPILEKGFNLHKNLLPAKIANRITILKENEDLLKHIPPQCLPQDCGGSSETLQQLKKKLEQHFVDNSKFYVDLGNLQPTGPIPEEYKDNYSNEFGSFRKLNID